AFAQEGTLAVLWRGYLAERQPQDPRRQKAERQKPYPLHTTQRVRTPKILIQIQNQKQNQRQINHKMSCPSGIIPSVERSIVGSTDSKGLATRQGTLGLGPETF